MVTACKFTIPFATLCIIFRKNTVNFTVTACKFTIPLATLCIILLNYATPLQVISPSDHGVKALKCENFMKISKLC